MSPHRTLLHRHEHWKQTRDGKRPLRLRFTVLECVAAIFTLSCVLVHVQRPYVSLHRRRSCPTQGVGHLCFGSETLNSILWLVWDMDCVDSCIGFNWFELDMCSTCVHCRHGGPQQLHNNPPPPFSVLTGYLMLYRMKCSRRTVEGENGVVTSSFLSNTSHLSWFQFRNISTWAQ